jgi:hypothetical protein
MLVAVCESRSYLRNGPVVGPCMMNEIAGDPADDEAIRILDSGLLPWVDDEMKDVLGVEVWHETNEIMTGSDLARKARAYAYLEERHPGEHAGFTQTVKGYRESTGLAASIRSRATT